PRLTSYQNPQTGRFETLVGENGQLARINRNWGRYWLLSRHSRRVVTYDLRSRTLTIPSSLPVPNLLAKSLTLCSGEPARSVATIGVEGRQSDYGFVYLDVPPPVAEKVLEK